MNQFNWQVDAASRLVQLTVQEGLKLPQVVTLPFFVVKAMMLPITHAEVQAEQQAGIAAPGNGHPRIAP